MSAQTYLVTLFEKDLGYSLLFVEAYFPTLSAMLSLMVKEVES